MTPDQEQGVVRVAGELDADTVDRIRECLQRLPQTAEGRVVVDIGAVEVIDWNGLGVLVGARQRVRQEGGVLVLRRPTPQANQLLERSGMGGLFIIEP